MATKMGRRTGPLQTEGAALGQVHPHSEGRGPERVRAELAHLLSGQSTEGLEGRDDPGLGQMQQNSKQQAVRGHRI